MKRPQRFRPKSAVEIMAIRYLGSENCAAVHEFLGMKHDDSERCAWDAICFDTLRGREEIGIGYWAVREAPGLVVVLSDKDFREHFEAIGD